MESSTVDLLVRRQQGQKAVIEPPPGVKQDFVNPPYATRDQNIFVAVGLTIAGLFIIVRVYTKQYILRNFGAEDGKLITLLSACRGLIIVYSINHIVLRMLALIPCHRSASKG